MAWQIGHKISLLAALVIATAGLSGANGQQSVREGWPFPMEASTVSVPQVFNVGGGQVLVYEIRLTNHSSQRTQLERIEVLTESGLVVAAFDGEDLRQMVRLLGARAQPTATTAVLEAYESAIVYFWVDLGNASGGGGLAPTSLLTSIAFRADDSRAPKVFRVASDLADIGDQAVTICPPVKGGRWWTSNGFGSDTNHRRFYTVSTSLLIPQRFGADFLKLDPSGASAEGSSLELPTFFAYEEPVYAVADGEVVGLLDGLPDSDVGEARATDFEWRHIPGNHVVLKIGTGQFALYAHLKAGSIQVKLGDQIGLGAKIGLIGNSGNSSNPHVHFHMQDSPIPNEGQGVPFHFKQYDVLVADYAFRPAQRPLPLRPKAVFRDSVPAVGTVVTFPEDCS